MGNASEYNNGFCYNAIFRTEPLLDQNPIIRIYILGKQGEAITQILKCLINVDA